MAYGIQLFNSRGEMYFNTETQTWNFIGSFIAPANETINVSFPIFDRLTEVLFQRSAVDNAPANQEGLIHTVYRSGNLVVCTSGNIRTLVTVLGR